MNEYFATAVGILFLLFYMWFMFEAGKWVTIRIWNYLEERNML